MFTIVILFGAAELLGTLVGEPVIKKFPDWIAMIVSVTFVMVSCLVLRMPGVGQTTIYLVFLFQIFFIGMAFNLAFMILETRNNPKLLAVAWEINMSIGAGSSMILPVFAKAPEPTPTLMFLIFGTICILMVLKIGPKKQTPKESVADKIERTVLSMVDVSMQEGNSFGGFRTNLSSVILDSNYI